MGLSPSCNLCRSCIVLLCLLVCVVVKTGLADHHEGPSQGETKFACPGRCVNPEDGCSAALNSTDCADGLVCCVENLESTSPAFIEWVDPTENILDVDGPEASEFDQDSSVGLDPSYLSYPGSDVANPSADVANSSPDAQQVTSASEGAEGCPGACVPLQYSEYCEYIVSATGSCAPDMTCCITSTQARKFGTTKKEPEKPVLTGRSSQEFDVGRSCPGTCVHPSHVIYCDRVLPEYPCPMNAKCCLQRTMQKAATKLVECTGQCLAPNMRGYCFPPNELIAGPTTCTRGTTCCMRRQVVNFVQQQTPNAPSTGSMPSKQPQVQSNAPEFLGHLAIDDNDNIFKVTPNGQISPLPKLPPQDSLRGGYTKITEFDRLNGKIVIFSDEAGVLYQQFLPRKPQVQGQQPPLVRQPINQFDSQASEHAATFQGQAAIPEDPTSDTSDEVVIPDDDDEAPLTPSTPRSINDNKTPRPPCPGSCMSYFLRFTCFRGHAIYDGFTCSGRQVCCARLSDIEEHEQYLKSLSPYFNAPPAARDPTLPKCGIKGRRDTPRVMGGKESAPGEWCWQVAVINMQNQYICGGALIDNSWVLTAAHCVVGPLRDNQALFVRVGVTNLRSPEDNSMGQTVRVLSTFIHHNFNDMNLDNDIALLRLQKPVEFTPNVCVICLPTSGQMPEENTKCTVTGYGFVSPSGDMSLRISDAQIPITDDMDCITNVTEALGNPFILPASSFCAGGQSKDVCQGDAGGPLACEVGGFHELVGLVSWSLGCGRNDVPSIYVKVPAFMGWINQIISSSSFLMSLN